MDPRLAQKSTQVDQSVRSTFETLRRKCTGNLHDDGFGGGSFITTPVELATEVRADPARYGFKRPPSENAWNRMKGSLWNERENLHIVSLKKVNVQNM